MQPFRRAVAVILLLTPPALLGQSNVVGSPGPRPTPARVAPGVELGALQVTARVVDGVATTELRQTVHNRGRRPAEANWILPLPPGASTDRFTMMVNGARVEGEVLDAARARGVYEQIVRRQRDPGLLEYAGAGCLRARIFPIPPRGEAVVEVRFRQVLPETGGLFHWRYPLRAPQVGSLRPSRMSIDLVVTSKKPIKNVFSPLGGVDVIRKGDHDARVSLELAAGQLPDRDLSVFYGLSEGEFGLNLLTYRKAGKLGYFMLMLAPKQEWDATETLHKAIQFVLDTSGSMQGRKIEQARKALRFFVQSLEPTDHFNVIPFSTEARPFFRSPVPASPEHVRQALDKIAGIHARGGTNIEDGLQTALATDLPEGVVPMTVFLTDGLPTVGTTDVSQLLTKLAVANTHQHRIFVLGVGNDVNTHLLDKVAERTRGVRDYLGEQEDLELKTGALFTKLSHPVLTDVEVRIDGLETTAITPTRLPDLFKGSRVLVLGRYEGAGQRAVRLRGSVRGAAKEIIYEGAFPAASSEHDFLPALWAERRVAVLLDAIRLNGRTAELTREVTRLGREYGIVTPFTSHLIVEETVRLGAARQRRGRRGVPGARGPSTPGPSGAGPTSGPRGAPVGGATTPLAEAERARRRLNDLGKHESGARAVADSKRILTGSDDFFMGGSRRKAAPGSPATKKKGVAQLTRRVKGRTFYVVKGVWVDAGYKASMKAKIRVIEAFSTEYFELLRKHPQLAPFVSFAERVRVVWGDEVIEIAASKA